MRSVALHACVSAPTTKICMKIDPYYQRQKCSPGILVSSKISFMQIFAGVRWRGASNESRVVEKGDFRFFRSLYLPNLHMKGHIYYIVLCSRLVALQWYRNRWPWMTLNSNFASNLFRAWQLMCWHLQLWEKTVRKFAELPIYCQWQKCSPGNVVSGGIRFMQVFAAVRWRGGVKWEWGSWKWRFWLHSFTFFRTFYIHGHTTAFRWYDCQWPWVYFKVIGLFHIEFLKNGVWYGKSYHRQLH